MSSLKQQARKQLIIPVFELNFFIAGDQEFASLVRMYRNEVDL